MSQTISVTDAKKAFRCLRHQLDEALELLGTLDPAQVIDLEDDNPVVQALKIKIGPIPVPECPPIPILTQGVCAPLVSVNCSPFDSDA